MEAYKREFIEFMVEAGVLTFGDFVTKSGRQTPYFVNTGRYRTGAQVEALGRFYASAIQASLPGDAVDVPIDPALGAELRRTARAAGASTFMLARAAVAVLLHRLGAGDDIPLGATGKIDKKLVRERMKDYVLPTAQG